MTDVLDVELIAREIPLVDDGEPHAEQIAPQLAELKAAGVDFLYLGSSSFLRKHRDILTGAALDQGIPVLSPYEELVRESRRSEEHTSELQSLMRISYAVSCLTKKKYA